MCLPCEISCTSGVPAAKKAPDAGRPCLTFLKGVPRVSILSRKARTCKSGASFELSARRPHPAARGPLVVAPTAQRHLTHLNPAQLAFAVPAFIFCEKAAPSNELPQVAPEDVIRSTAHFTISQQYAGLDAKRVYAKMLRKCLGPIRRDRER